MALAAIGGCGSDDGSNFNQDAVIEQLRPGWPGLTDEELADKADVFREACTQKLDRTAEVSFALLLQDDTTRAILTAGCPDRVTKVDG